MIYSMNDMAKAGCTTLRGIRFWESEGLLGIVERTSGDTRRFTQDQLDRARIIASAKFGGWELSDIKVMIGAYDAEAYQAIITRLLDQANAAETLAATLPKPKLPEMEYDL